MTISKHRINTVARLSRQYGMSVSRIARELEIKPSSVERYLRLANERPKMGAKIGLLDIETSTMAVRVWGLYKQRIPEQNIIKDWFIIAWCGKWLYNPKVVNFIVNPNESKERDDRRIMFELWQFLDESDIIIAHNAQRFDIRKINDRFLEYGYSPPSSYQVIDTLKVTQRQFASSSHRLDYYLKRLKLGKKLETNYQLWVDCENGESDALDRMELYNINDVFALEDLYLTIRPWIPSHPNVTLYNEEIDVIRCSKCNSPNIYPESNYLTTASRFPEYRCQHCGGLSRSRYATLTKEDRQKTLIPLAR